MASVSSLALALTGLGTAGAAAPSWHVSPLSGQGEYNASTVYDGQLQVFTSGFDAGLGHEWWDGRRWNYAILDGPGSSEPGHTADSVGQYNAVAVYDGQLQVFTYDASTGGLRDDWWDGRRWNFGVLDGPGSSQPGHSTDNVGQYNAVTVYDGQLEVFTYDATTGSLRHDWWDGRRWNFETLDGPASTRPGHTTDNVGQSPAVTVYNGQLHVFADDTTTGGLRQDWWDGRTWHFGVLDGPGSSEPGHTAATAWGSTSAVVYGTQLHVFSGAVTGSEDMSADSLRHDWWDGARWHFGIMDAGMPCQSSSMCEDVDRFGASIVAAVYNGQLHVFSAEFTELSYPYPGTESLQHDWWDGTSWHHTSQLERDSYYVAWPDPDIAVTVYNDQLHVFTYAAGLLDFWWG